MAKDKSNDPFPSNEIENIYAPPQESPQNTDPTIDSCPRCGKKMETGELYSNSLIKWLSAKHSKMKKFIAGGDPIAKTKSGLGCKYPAHYCKNCKLFTLLE